MKKELWQELAEKLRTETNTEQIIQLSNEIVKLMDQDRVQNPRLTSTRQQPAA